MPPDFIELFETYTAVAGKRDRDIHYSEQIAPFLDDVAAALAKKYNAKKLFPHVSNFRTHILFRLGLDKKQTHRASIALSFGDDYMLSGFDLTHALGDAHHLRHLIQQKPGEVTRAILALEDYSLYMPHAGIKEVTPVDELEFDELKKCLLAYHPQAMRECYFRIDRDLDEESLTQEDMIELFDQEYQTFRFLMDAIQDGLKK